MTLVLGIDPGVNGAAALLRCGGERPELVGLRPVMAAMDLVTAATSADLVVVEAQHAASRQSAVSAFRLGHVYGWLQGVLETVEGPRVVHVQPAVWRGAYGLSGGRGEGKASGVVMARELTGRAVMTHDEADAILLAWWGWRNVLSCGSGEVGT